MRHGIRIHFAIATLALFPTLAHADGAQQRQAQQDIKLPAGLRVVTGLRPDQAQRVSHEKPKMERIKARAISWGVQNEFNEMVQRQARRGASGRSDPYRITLEGANHGTQIAVSKKGPLQPIAMPEVERLALRDGKGRRIDSAKWRKIVNRDYNKQLAKAVATARRDEALISATQSAPSSAQPVVIESPAPLPTNSVLTVQAIDPFGRRYPSKEVVVDGAPYWDTGWSGWRPAGNISVQNRQQGGGRFQPSEQAQIVKANLRSTPVLERIVDKGYQKVDGKWQRVKQKQTFVKVLGLAAFSPSSTVTITNRRMQALGGDEAARAAVSFQSNSKGAGDVEVPALLGDELYVQVDTRKGPEIQGSTTHMIVKIPSATRASKLMHDRYLPVE
jgi:hypothetical protein